MIVTVAVAFISAVSGVLWSFWSSGFALLYGAWCEVSGCCCYFMRVPLHVVLVLLCLVFGET